MEKDLNPYLQKGAKIEDLVAGLSLSIVTNYLNRVVRGRHIGDCIFFQGGTAYNDATAAAFATVLDKEITLLPISECERCGHTDYRWIVPAACPKCKWGRMVSWPNYRRRQEEK